MHFINNHITTLGLKHYKNPTKDKEQKKKFLLQALKIINNECLITSQNISFIKQKLLSSVNLN
jgi:hypothetical protein